MLATRAILKDLSSVHEVYKEWEVGWALTPMEENAYQLHNFLIVEVR
jgi:hypothetical protein